MSGRTPDSQYPARVPGTASADGVKPLWRARQGGRTVFRHPVPLVLFWAWVAFAVANFIDVATGGHVLSIFRLAAGLALVTGVIYACTLQSRVEADEDGVTVFNPLRQHRAPWGAIEGVFLGDSVEFSCARPAPKSAKTVYSWALYSSRRSRARSQMQRGMFTGLTGRRSDSVWSSRPGGMSARAPAEAAELAKQPAAQLMATELGDRVTAARDRGAPAGVLASNWSWRPLVAIIAPAVLLTVLLLVH